jgi:electron transport complex protein RnfC
MKGSIRILAFAKGEANLGKESPCIRCGKCIDACPMGLNPSMLSILGERDHYEEAKTDYNLLDCIECGSCVYGCPAKRNIVQYIKYMKAQNVAKMNAEKAKAAAAAAKAAEK